MHLSDVIVLRFSPLGSSSASKARVWLPKERGMPLSRYSTRDLAQVVIERGIVAAISGTTFWR